MAHRLEPPLGKSYLTPKQAVQRLREEFAFCDIDPERGRDVVGDMLVKLIEMKAPAAIIDSVVAGRPDALHVTIADDGTTEDYLEFTVRPNDGILIGYFGSTHEVATKSLIDRCARALSYEAHLV